MAHLQDYQQQVELLGLIMQLGHIEILRQETGAMQPEIQLARCYQV